MTTVTDILTLGGRSELDIAREAYEAAYRDYLVARSGYNGAHDVWVGNMRALGSVTNQAIAATRRSYAIILFPEGRQARRLLAFDAVVDNPRHEGLDHFLKLLDSHAAEQSVAGGVGAGSVVAMGSWSLVSMMGTASTGTAIGTLSGAAATNATMAWFGGGALAAGGAGMAGGAVMLGGLAVVPVIAFATWHTRSKIKQIRAETDRIRSETARTSQAAALLRQQAEVAGAKADMLDQPTTDLEMGERATRDRVFAVPVVSKARKAVMRLLGRPVFDPEEAAAVDRLASMAARLAACFAPPAD